MKEQKMNLEEYKKKVEEFLEANYKLTTKPSPLMKEYENDFPMFLKDGWEPEVAALAMVAGF